MHGSKIKTSFQSYKVANQQIAQQLMFQLGNEKQQAVVSTTCDGDKQPDIQPFNQKQPILQSHVVMCENMEKGSSSIESLIPQKEESENSCYISCWSIFLIILIIGFIFFFIVGIILLIANDMI